MKCTGAGALDHAVVEKVSKSLSNRIGLDVYSVG